MGFSNYYMDWLFCFLAFLPSLISIFLLTVCTKRAIIFASAILCTSLAVLCLVIDICVYGQYHFHLNSIILQMIFNSEATQVFDFSLLEKSLFVLLVTTILFIETIYANWLWSFLQNNAKIFTVSSHQITVSLFLSYNMFLLSSIQPTSIIFQQPQAFPLYTTVITKIIPKLSHS